MATIKSFEDFLDRMQGLLDNAKKQGHMIVRVEDLENAFPELAESEDERIRKEIISYIKSSGAVTNKQWVAWLEKQVKQKPVPDWMPKFLDELRTKKNYFDWDIEGSIIAIIDWMNPNYFNKKK